MLVKYKEREERWRRGSAVWRGEGVGMGRGERGKDVDGEKGGKGVDGEKSREADRAEVDGAINARAVGPGRKKRTRTYTVKPVKRKRGRARAVRTFRGRVLFSKAANSPPRTYKRNGTTVPKVYRTFLYSQRHRK